MSVTETAAPSPKPAPLKIPSNRGLREIISPHRSYRRLPVTSTGALFTLPVVLLVEVIVLLCARPALDAMTWFGTFVANHEGIENRPFPDPFLFVTTHPMTFAMRHSDWIELCVVILVCALGVVLLSVWTKIAAPIRFFINLNLLLIAGAATYLLLTGRLGYDSAAFSELMVRTALFTWLVLPVFVGLFASLFPFKPWQRLVFIFVTVAYDVPLSIVRYGLFIAILGKTSSIAMADLYLVFGPLLDAIPIICFFTLLPRPSSSLARRSGVGVGMVIVLLQAWTWVVVAIMVTYAVRHWRFTWNRLAARQRPYYQDLLDSELPHVSVIVPMHNEAAVARKLLDALVDSNYPHYLLEVIPVDDQSGDATPALVYEYSQKYSFIRPIYNLQGERGKALALNRALELATHEVVLVFDADYTPGRDLIRELAMAFIDPEVGAVMGRVVPRNSAVNLLTRLLSLERSGGYQVDQQARYNLDLMTQYGGTVGGFRRSVVIGMGGFDTLTLAEDTDLTIRLFIKGWRVLYANRAECYEEVPETWDVRFTQLRRWSRGHNRAFFANIIPLVRSKKLTFVQKFDGALLLFIYTVPPILLLGIAVNALLFYMGAIPVVPGIIFAFFVVAYNAFGNFAPVFEVGAAELLDGAQERLLLLPCLFYLFLFNSWAVTTGAIDAFGDWLKTRRANWDKTKRAGAADAAR